MQNQKRQDILEAIRKTAKANGEKPLGKRAFEVSTGFKESEWSGIYWARWSDALKEAGFTPTNTFNKRAEKFVLLEKLIPAIRHFGRLPTTLELRIYTKENPGVPNEKTLRNHFGAKEDLAIALFSYTNENAELQDIAALFKQYNFPEKETGKAIVNEGHVYLFKSGAHYKIGKTDNLERRVKEVSVALPEALTIIHTIRTDDPDGIEAYWHRRFSTLRAKGEWFKLSTSDIKAFKRRTFQ